MKRFYRVSNTKTQQGLWYDFTGNFTGHIHKSFNFCQNSALAMDFDESIVGYLSATPELESLFHWFSKEDIAKLQQWGYYIHVYESDDYWFYEKFQHYVIKQDTAVLIEQIDISKLCPDMFVKVIVRPMYTTDDKFRKGMQVAVYDGVTDGSWIARHSDTGLLTYEKKVAKAHPNKTIIEERTSFENIDWDLAGFSPHEMRR
jgi:hypothetical protein